ncbi:unnamed protein product [Cuscuta europaea]|uniref:Uncharacterized protein n=1 Tax=Cuscuta europaea TaxID=41803 RepID=A0A9P0YVK5_CUSEU|nr:unnamed protein product [Cuscuta europaea]
MAGTQKRHNIDDAIYPQDRWVKVLDNNFQLDLTIFKCQDPVIPGILKRHYLWTAFHKSKSVPEIYLQQVWGHMRTESTKDRTKILTKFNNMRIVLTPATLRSTLALPEHDSYDPLPSSPDLLKDVVALGYDSLLPKLSNFNGAYLYRPWKSLFGLVNKCLSPKHAGLDKCNKQIFCVFHGIAYNKKYDMAQLFFSELMDMVKAKEKNRSGTIPYARWLGLIIHDCMTANTSIPRRTDDPHFIAPKLQYFKADKKAAQGLRIPDALLNLANQSNPIIVAYKENLERTVPTVQKNPSGPTQGTKPRVSKGPKSAPKAQKPVARRPDEGESDESLERTRTTEGKPTNAEESADDSLSSANKEADDEASDSVARSDNANDDNDDDDDDVDHTFALIQKGKLPIESPPKKITAEDAAPIIATRPKELVIKTTTASHKIASATGIVREQRIKAKNDAPQSLNSKKRRLVKRHLVDEDEMHIFADCQPFINISRAESLSAGADLFGSRVEVAASGSTAQAQPSPSHSIASQQAIVSKQRDSPTSLVPSEPVERISDQQPEVTTTSLSTSSLGVTLPTFSNFSRTPTLFTAHTGARTLEATTRVPTMTVGSPATPTMTPSLNAGHTSALFTDDVTTVTTPVTEHLTTEDVTVLMHRFLDSTIKPWVQQAFTAWAQESKTTPAVHSEHNQPEPHPSPSHTKSQTSPVISATSTKVHSPISSRGTHDTEQVSSPHPTTPPIELLSQPFEVLASILLDHLLNIPHTDLTPYQQGVLTALLANPDTKGTCRESPRGRKRSHEDPDDPEPHEGENKRPRILEQGASTTHSPQTEQPETFINQPPPSTCQNQAYLSSVVELDKTSRGVSPRDTVRGGDGSPDDATTGTSFTSGHQLEPSSKLMSTGNPSEPGRATKEQSPPQKQQRVPYIPPGKDIHDALEEAVIYDKWPRKWTEWDDLRVEAEQEDMQRNWWLRELINKCSEDIIRLEDDERKEGENYKESQKTLESVVRQTAGRLPKTEKPWDNVRIKAPFQEEIRKQIWRRPDKVKPLNELKLRGLTHLKGKQAGGHLHMLLQRSTGTQRELMEQDLKSNILPIHQILQVKAEDYHGVTFYTFRLQRTDGSEFTCQENDFIMLKPDDIYQILMAYRYLPVRQSIVYSEGLAAIKRFMLRQIRVHSSHDLQMAIECNLKKTNLTKPKLYGPELEDFPAYHIFFTPPAVTYLNYKNEKRLMVVSEIEKYCDGTLKIIREQILQMKAKLEENLQEASSYVQKEHSTVETILKAIDDRLEKRNVLRQYEHALGLRKHYFKSQKQ